MKKAIVYLEDGTVFTGRFVCGPDESCGEVVFNTAMTGYQEILTDPSYAGQIVVMTYPLIGNYGVNPDDEESDRVHARGFIVKELCRHPSNQRMTESLLSYLQRHQITTVEGIDTRALTRRLRMHGAMRGILSNRCFDRDELARRMQEVPSMQGADWVKTVTTPQPYTVLPDPPVEEPLRVAAIDCGIKKNILRILARKGCVVTVFPATATAQDILAVDPEGVFVSNGPGDPAALDYVVGTLKSLLGNKPVFGICLGHQLLGLALGGRTFKLKFGHHGANHPVEDRIGGRIDITSQNHGFCVDPRSLPQDVLEVVDVNLNDRTLEGIRHKEIPAYSIQFHPEAAPGPHDALYLFDPFIEEMKARRGR